MLRSIVPINLKVLFAINNKKTAEITPDGLI